MTIKKLPSSEYLHKLFRYEPETGNLYRRIRISNSTKAGDSMGSAHNGYLRVGINGIRYRVHRVIYKMLHGIDPHYIDHINGIRDDNRIDNLRSVSHQENCKNTKIRKDNTSGRIGVYWHKATKRWKSYITVKQKHIHLGLFDNLKDAVEARKSAEIEYKFHKNHGRAA